MKTYKTTTEDRLLIIGAGGLTKQCLKTLLQQEYQRFHITVFDDVNESPNNFGYTLETDWKNINTHFSWYTHYMICLGNPQHRKEFSKKLSMLTPLNLISQNINGHDCKIGDGCIILDNVLIEPYSEIGNHVLLNHGAKIFHDAIIGNYTEISPGATILGNVRIGEGCRIGANAIILPDLTIGVNCIVGAGAVVTKNIPDNSIVVGIPARDI